MNTKPSISEATAEDQQKIVDIVKAADIALLTTQTSSGALHSRPLAAQDAEFDGDLWFFTQDPSPKVDDIAQHPQVNASFSSGKAYLSVAGTAEVVHDQTKIDQYWTPSVEAWFREGKDDAAVALIRVHAESAEFWATDKPMIVTAFTLAKARVTGERPDVGENKSVEL